MNDHRYNKRHRVLQVALWTIIGVCLLVLYWAHTHNNLRVILITLFPLFAAFAGSLVVICKLRFIRQVCRENCPIRHRHRF